MTASPRARLLLGAAAALFLVPACGHRCVLPEDLHAQVDWSLPYEYLARNPDFYAGKLVCFGGEVLSGRRSETETRLEILQLPLDAGHEPTFARSLSQGRFLAYQKTFLDPATLPRGTRVSVAGVVRGVETAALDDAQYAYPVLDIRHLVVWHTGVRRAPAPRFHIGIGGVFVR